MIKEVPDKKYIFNHICQYFHIIGQIRYFYLSKLSYFCCSWIYKWL